MARKSLSSEQYWRQWEEAQRRKNITDEREYAKEIGSIYANMLDNVQKEIESFYARYADKEGITLAEAKKRVSKLDIEAYERKAKRYVQAAARDRKANGKTDKNASYFSEQANEEMRLYNLTMKVNRLEMLKANIGLELVSGFDELQKFYDEKLTKRTLAEFERQAGILGRSVQNNAKYAHAIVNASFHNATFSDRIWKEQAVLKSELDKLLQIGLIQGRNPRVLARDLQKRFHVSQSDAERLMITELRRVQTEAAKQSYLRNGYEEYQFLALGSACSVCAELNEKHFKVREMQTGVNAPPMHPNCRCSTSAYMDREEFERYLDEENRKMHERMEAEEEVNAGPSLIGTIASGVLTSDRASNIIKPDQIVSGHSGTPKEANPGSVIDHVDENDEVDVRTFYNDAGLKGKDIHTTDHGNSRRHPYGKYGEHAHDYDWDVEKKLRNKTTRELTERERKENGDIL